jgi:hypothetical protein
MVARSKGEIRRGENALKRLAAPHVDVKPTLAMIIETDRLEVEMETGTTYWDCFKKVNLRRTEISVGVYTIQVFSGIYLVGYATYFFQRKFSPWDMQCELLTVFQLLVFPVPRPSPWAWDILQLDSLARVSLGSC